jgi:hypothetical protein
LWFSPLPLLLPARHKSRHTDPGLGWPISCLPLKTGHCGGRWKRLKAALWARHH